MSGVSKVEVGVFGPMIDPSLPYTATLPTAWQVATLSAPHQPITPWSINVPLNGNGDYRVYARAIDQATNSTPDVNWYQGNVWINSSPVTLTGASAVLNAPSVISKTNMTLSGTVTSATAIQQLRVYNGFEWRRLPPTLGAWSSKSELPRTDAVTLTLRSVARDAYGHTLHVSRSLAIDTLAQPPQLFANLNVNQWHIDVTPTLVITWPTVLDGSGAIAQWAAIDTQADTVPTTTTVITQVSKLLNQPGAYYGHVRIVDAAGNEQVAHSGPFLINRSTTPSSINPDGLIDTTGEYPNGTRLNFDPFGLAKSIGLWGTWDANNLYLGYRSANWSAFNQLAIYLDTQAGGLNQTMQMFSQTHNLPFAADYAFVLGATNKLYAVNGSAWVEVPNPISYAATNVDTEIVLKRSEINATGAVQLLAFTADAQGVQNVLPAHARPTSASFYTSTVNFAGALQWNALSNGVQPAAGQYQSLNPVVQIDSGTNTTLYTNTTTLHDDHGAESRLRGVQQRAVDGDRRSAARSTTDGADRCAEWGGLSLVRGECEAVGAECERGGQQRADDHADAEDAGSGGDGYLYPAGHGAARSRGCASAAASARHGQLLARLRHAASDAVLEQAHRLSRAGCAARHRFRDRSEHAAALHGGGGSEYGFGLAAAVSSG